MIRSETRERNATAAPFGAPHVHVLAVIEGDDPSAVFRIRSEQCTIGRDEATDCSIADSEVSARHCLMRVAGSVCSLLDLESLNGTLLNGQRLSPGVARRLRHLDEIQIGTTRLLFLAGRYRPHGRADPSTRIGSPSAGSAHDGAQPTDVE